MIHPFLLYGNIETMPPTGRARFYLCLLQLSQSYYIHVHEVVSIVDELWYYVILDNVQSHGATAYNSSVKRIDTKKLI